MFKVYNELKYLHNFFRLAILYKEISSKNKYKHDRILVISV